MESQGNIRVLKAVVIGLGLLILLSIGIIVVTIYRRMAADSATPTIPRMAMAPADAITDGGSSLGLRTFGDRKVDLPSGARLVETRIAGDRMFLRARLLGGNEVWIVLSLLTGDRLGSFELVAE